MSDQVVTETPTLFLPSTGVLPGLQPPTMPSSQALDQRQEVQEQELAPAALPGQDSTNLLKVRESQMAGGICVAPFTPFLERKTGQ